MAQEPTAQDRQDAENANTYLQKQAALNPASNGYEMLVKAGKLILPGENGSPSAAEILTPDENLRRQRESDSMRGACGFEAKIILQSTKI